LPLDDDPPALPPDALTANQIPWIPCPLACPGLESPEYVYSGIPSNVTCISPPGRWTVPKDPLTPDPPEAPESPDGTSRGGQIDVHCPVHTIFDADSGVMWYSVSPFGLTRTEPRLDTDFDPITSSPPDAAAPDFAQAASGSAIVATAPMAAIRFRNLIVRLRSIDECQVYGQGGRRVVTNRCPRVLEVAAMTIAGT